MAAISSNTGLLSSFREDECEDICFVTFFPPASDGWSQWVETLEAIDYDLHHLLKLPHHKFWTQILHDKSLHRLLDSYLQHAPRPYEEVWSLTPQQLEILRNIHKRIFLVFVRMATHKEDPSNEFSPSLYGDLIYIHSLFTIPRLFDLSSLYGSTNTPLLNKMMDNIFTKQPCYMRELGNVIQTNVIDALKDLTQKCTLNPERADVKDICDYVLFYTDITHSLLSLILVYPLVGPVMWDTKICEELIMCYEYAIVSCLQEQVKELKIIDKKNHSVVSTLLKLAKENTCHIVYKLLMESGSHGNTGPAHVDSLMSCLGLVASEKSFSKEFNKHYNLMDCIQSLKEKYSQIDDTQLQYVMSAITGKAPPTQTAPTTQGKSKKPKDLRKSVENIKELLPHLDDEFIKACLKEFRYNHEVVINHILEGTLPPHLAMGQLEYEPHPQADEPRPEEPHPLEEGYSILEERRGIYDYDEFDVFNKHNIDLRNVHIGKKHDYADDILSDRSHIKYFKNKGLDLMSYDQYEDEYDDTYDSHNVGVVENVPIDQLISVRRLNEKGMFSSTKKWTIDSDGEGEEKEGDIIVQPPVKILQRPTTPDNVKKKHTQNTRESSYKGGGGAKGGGARKEGGGNRGKKKQLRKVENETVVVDNDRAEMDGARPHPHENNPKGSKVKTSSSEQSEVGGIKPHPQNDKTGRDNKKKQRGSYSHQRQSNKGGR